MMNVEIEPVLAARKMKHQQEPITVKCGQILRLFKGGNKDSLVSIDGKHKVEVPYLMVSSLQKVK